MNSDRNIHKIGLVNLVVLLLVGGAMMLLSQRANSATGLASSFFIILGFLTAAFSYFQMRLISRENLEQLEYEELRKSPNTSALFTAEADTFPARRSRIQFERFMIPAFSIFIVIFSAFSFRVLWGWLSKDLQSSQEQALVAMSLSSLFALVLFLLGKYSSGLAALENQRLLRPGASFSIIGSVIGSGYCWHASLRMVWLSQSRYLHGSRHLRSSGFDGC